MPAFLDRFRRNKSKAQAECPAQIPEISSVWPEDKRDTLGLRSLYEPSDPQAAIVDIVFVHGLTGNSYTTWLHESGCHWPEKLLPDDIPDSRILSFGYDADVARFWGPASGNTVANHAQNLLGALSRLRGRTDTEDRKIIFVAHSLGGLVTKNALWLSSGSAEHHIRNVGSHTIGIAFLGTPHHGADLAAWATFGSRICQIVKKSNTEILAVLKPGSEVLAAIEDGFGNQLRIRNDQDFDITCFYEELPLPLVGDVVPKHSAIMGGRPSYGIHANHMSMTKFAHSKSQGYVVVSGELFRWVKDVRIRKKAVLEDCLESFNFEEISSQTRRPSKQPAAAYDWIWTRPDTTFPEWIDAGRGIFWISGKPGSGKSTMMRQIVGNLTDGHAAVQSSTERVRRITASYFFDFSSSESARSPSAAFNTIIYQLLSQEPSLAKPVLPVYEKTKATKTEFKWDMEYLHRCVSEIFRSFTDIVFLVIIDALDESSMESFDMAEMLISLAKEFPTNLQICVSSRPIIGFTDQFACYPRITMEDQTTADITRYTDSRFHELIDCQRSKTRDLVAAVVDKSEGIFLWVKLVNDILIRASRRGEDLESLRQRLKAFPKDLNAFYQRMLDDLDPEDHEEGRTMLAIVTGAVEPLSPLDLRRAVHLSLGIYTDIHNAELASRRVMAVCSGLLEIRGSIYLRVHLAHETVKSFLSVKRDILKWTSPAGAIILGNVLLLKASILLLQEFATSYWEMQQARSYKLAEWRQWADPFLVYSVKWWVLHAQRSEREIKRAPSILRQFQPFQYEIWRQLFTESPWMLRYEEYEHSSQPTEQLEELQKLYEGIPNTLQELVVSLNLPLVARDLLEHSIERDSGELLYAVAKSGNLAMARMILERNTRIDRMSPLGRYSLCRAVYFGQIQIARLLLKHGADPNAPAVYWRDLENTPLQVAVRMRNKELIELLSEFGADLNGRDANHVTALTAAAQQGDADLVELLTRLGANVNVSEDSEGLGGALGAAIRTPDPTSRPTMIATLLQRGADPNAIQPHNDVPLIWAAVESCDIQAVESLIRHGAKLNLVDRNGHTVLYKVIAMFRELRYASLKEIGRALITNGAKFNELDCTTLALYSRPDYAMSTEQTMAIFEQTLTHGWYEREASSRNDVRDAHLQGLRVTNLLALRGSTPHMWDYVRAQNSPSPAPRTYFPPAPPPECRRRNNRSHQS